MRAAAEVILETERLILRRCRGEDAEALTRLLQDREIAERTLTIPHPYTIEDARAWLARLEETAASGEASMFAITLREDGALAGTVGLKIERAHERAELGYWVGKAFWGRGIATEAARRMVAHGFDDLGLNRIYAGHWSWNPASGRVLENAGLQREGRVREHFMRFGKFEDSVEYGILKREYDARKRSG